MMAIPPQDLVAIARQAVARMCILGNTSLAKRLAKETLPKSNWPNISQQAAR